MKKSIKVTIIFACIILVICVFSVLGILNNMSQGKAAVLNNEYGKAEICYSDVMFNIASCNI